MNWTSTDIIVLILVIIVAVVMIGSIARPSITGDKISPDGIDIIGKLMASIIALIGVYIGNKLKKD